MPEVSLNIPTNSRFHSSLNEIDLAMGGVLLNQMRIADPRTSAGLPETYVTDKNDWLWDESRVFQVDELSTEEIFNTYLLRKKINNKKDVDVSYPLLAFIQNDIDTVFWGTGNRFRQWEFDLPTENLMWEKGDEVTIVSPIQYRGNRANVEDTITEGGILYCQLSLNGTLLTEKDIAQGGKTVPLLFPTENLRQIGDKIGSTFKAKSVTGTYTAVVLCDTRDELQYLRDRFILRCADGQIWHKYKSPAIQNTENQIFTVFGIPNIERYPKSEDKVAGEGYIYGMAFDITFWGCLTDTPLPKSIIEQIRLSVQVEGDGQKPRIVIS